MEEGLHKLYKECLRASIVVHVFVVEMQIMQTLQFFSCYKLQQCGFIDLFFWHFTKP